MQNQMKIRTLGKATPNICRSSSNAEI